jgi:flavin-dependent dehydrogenase
MGNVSHVVPSIHPYLAIVGEGEALCHQHKFAHAAASERGLDTAIAAAKALARTAVELLVDADLRQAVRTEWEASAPKR